MNKERKLVLWITFQNKDLSQAFFKNNSKEEKMEEGKKKLCLQYRKQKLNLGFDHTAKLLLPWVRYDFLFKYILGQCGVCTENFIGHFVVYKVELFFLWKLELVFS